MEWVDNGHRLIVKYLDGDPVGREVSVTPRLYNTIISIGPRGEQFIDDHW